MRRYFGPEALAFLRELKTHNDRAWFAGNKERYERALKEPFLDLIEDAGPELHKLSRYLTADPSQSGGSLFRIHRDVRFSRDKSPYKTHAGAHFPLGPKDGPGPGYYLHVEPGSCFVAGGIWMPQPPTLQRIRVAIAERPAAWKRARGELDHAEDPLKRPPRGFDQAHPMIEDLMRRSFTSSVRLSDRQVTGRDLMQAFIASCREIAPLMRFLATAVGARW